MVLIVKKNTTIGLILTVFLLIAYMIGLIIPTLEIGLFMGILLIPVLLILIYFLLQYMVPEEIKVVLFKKLTIWIMLVTNFLFAFIIGYTIPLMEDSTKNNLGYIMIPMLIILNFIILDRFQYFIRHVNDRKGV
ncbi:MAG: archaeosortase H N-terminal-like domain-containing protein [Promethearchaeota archaeon]